MIQLSLELLKFDNFSLLCCFYTIECDQFVFSRTRQLLLNIFHEFVELLHSILLGLLYLFYTALYLAYIVFEVTQSSVETTGFTSDEVYMPLVYFLKLLKLMRLMSVTKQTTIRADRHFTRLAEVAEWSVVLRTELFFALLSLCLLRLHHLHHIREKSALDQLIGSQRDSTVRTLGFSLLHPFPQTVTTTEFGAVRAHDCVRNSPEANEAAEDLFKLCVSMTHCIGSTRTSCDSSGVDCLDAAPTVVTTG